MENLVIGGASFLGSLLMGKFKKHKVPALPNKAIPFTNPIVAAGITASVAQDPEAVIVSALSSIVATLVHMAFKYIKAA